MNQDVFPFKPGERLLIFRDKGKPLEVHFVEYVNDPPTSTKCRVKQLDGQITECGVGSLIYYFTR